MLKTFSKYLIFFGFLLAGIGASAADAGRERAWFSGKKELSQAGQAQSHKEQIKQRRAERVAARENIKNAQQDAHEQTKGGNLDASTDLDTAVGKGRLTLEERRALRRQIREASNNLYVPPK